MYSLGGVTMSPTTKAARKAVTKYVKDKYDRVVLTMPKGKRDTIKDAAHVIGISVNGFINQAIDYYMSDDEYCQQLYENYLANTDPDKDETITIEDFAKELGVKL
jgi:hypothetical protein